jgi:hypothetical protein
MFMALHHAARLKAFHFFLLDNVQGEVVNNTLST